MYLPALGRNDSCYGPQDYNHLQTPNRLPAKDILCYPPASPPGSYHPLGVNVAFADGRVEFVTDEIDWKIWLEKGTREHLESHLRSSEYRKIPTAYVHGHSANGSEVVVRAAVGHGIKLVIKKLEDDQGVTKHVTPETVFSGVGGIH